MATCMMSVARWCLWYLPGAVLTWRRLVQGEFHSGYKHGYGELRYREDGGTYVGEWRRDKFHGKGLREFVNGTS